MRPSTIVAVFVFAALPVFGQELYEREAIAVLQKQVAYLEKQVSSLQAQVTALSGTVGFTKSGADLVLNAGSTGNIKIEGATLSVKTGYGTTFDAGAQFAVKASMWASLEASGTTSVTGSRLNLNGGANSLLSTRAQMTVVCGPPGAAVPVLITNPGQFSVLGP